MFRCCFFPVAFALMCLTQGGRAGARQGINTRFLRNPGASKAPGGGPVAAPTPAPPSSGPSATLGQSIDSLAAGIMGQLRRTNGDANVVFSPLSIAACFALLHPGAQGATRESLDNVFGFQGGAIATELLQRANGIGATTLANRVYFAPDIRLQQSYVDAIGPASLGQVDFASPQATQEVNAWVAQVTNGFLSNLVPEGVFSAATRLALVNAIFFKGSWADPFPVDLTRQGVFRGTSGPQTADFMMPESFQRYRSKRLESMNAQMLEFPYDDGQHAMFVVLPDSDDGWATVEAAIAPQLSPSFFLDGLVNSLEFFVKMPKWDFEMSIDNLGTILANLGLQGVFADADLRGITESMERLFVSHAIHKARIQVDEQGTTAAAGTVGAVATSLPPPAEDFHMDRPFLYYIVNLQDGVILFQGTVTNI